MAAPKSEPHATSEQPPTAARRQYSETYDGVQYTLRVHSYEGEGVLFSLSIVDPAQGCALKLSRLRATLAPGQDLGTETRDLDGEAVAVNEYHHEGEPFGRGPVVSLSFPNDEQHAWVSGYLPDRSGTCVLHDESLQLDLDHESSR